MTQKIKTKYQWLEDFINGFEELQDKTHNARCEIVKTQDLISHQENTFKQCLEDIHKRLRKVEANESDLLEIKQEISNIKGIYTELNIDFKKLKYEGLEAIQNDLDEIYQRLGHLEDLKQRNAGVLF